MRFPIGTVLLLVGTLAGCGASDDIDEQAVRGEGGVDVTMDASSDQRPDGGSLDAGLDGTLEASVADGRDASSDLPDVYAPSDATADIFDAPYDGPPWGERHRSCGGSATGHCEEVVAPGGSYAMGKVGAGDDNNGKMTQADVHPVTVTDFKIETHEVTVARFRAFFADGMPAPPDGYPIALGIVWQPVWTQGIHEPNWERAAAYPCAGESCPVVTQESCTWALANGQVDAGPTGVSFESKAVNCITWFTAAAFCAWDGMRLATEAEWEYVARNRGVDEWYPWGDALPTCEQANFGANVLSCPDQPRGYPQDIASHPAGDTLDPPGVHDLIGGVAEWTADFYQPYGGGCWQVGKYGVDPLCLSDPVYQERHVSRAGSWALGALRAEDRDGFVASSAWRDVGFRCARK